MDQIKLAMKENTSNGHSSIRTNGLSVTSSTNHNGSSSEDNPHEQTNKRELFLKAFEKPTQIYRYLRARHSISPIFLHRNLWYMKQRTTRDNSRRKTFKVDSIREIVEKRMEEMRKTNNQNNHFSNLVIRFSGIEDKTLDNKSSVTVNVSLKRSTKNKHDSSLQPTSEIREIGEYKLSASPAEKLTLTKENFISNAKHILVFKVSILRPQSANSQHQLTNGGNLNGDYTNGDLSDKEEIFSASASKRRRACNEVLHRYKAELVISGNSPETMLKDGEYNLTLNECLPATNGDCRLTNVHERFGKKVIWENASKLNSQVKEYLHEPYLSFQLKWSSDLNGEIVAQKSYLYSKVNQLSAQPLKQIDPPNNAENSHSNKSSSYSKNSRKFSASNASSLLLNGCATNGSTNGSANGFGCPVPSSKRSNVQEAVSNRPQQSAQAGDSKMVYRFIHNNDELQLLKTNSDFMCPWCSIQCFQIFSLKYHLRYVHNRFNFLIGCDGSTGYKIDVTINEQFDGSYCGNPQYDMSNFTSNSRRRYPVQRTAVTLLNLNLRGKRQSLSAYLENESNEINFDLKKQEAFGHNRLYYHSGTCQPIKPHELDEDSEDERDPEWMRIKTQIMIDEFSDVNEGEKEVMKLWNLHMMKHSFVGWGHVPLACELFIKENWQEIVKRNIYMNFVLHLNNLLDYQLLSSDTLRNLIKLFHELKSKRN